MTNKQRAKIYRQAAEKIIIIKKYKADFYSKYAFACNIIGRVSQISCNKESFPEFFLFKNRERAFNHAWWDYGGYELEPRIIALLFAEQIALNP